jgi:polysaccharide deacetylase family protein (PEP-CTERM system associated)
MIKHALTVDVEDYFHVAALADVFPPDTWGKQELRAVDSTLRLLDLFEERSVQATFFILGWVAERAPELVKRIHAAGHEVASHGYSHQLVYRQPPDEFRSETEASKKLLEDQIGAPIQGYRAASYSITRQNLWALDILCEAGFTYDSSIFPVYHDRYGIPNTPRKPYRLQTQSGQEILEFPITTTEIGGYKLPIAGGGYFRIFPYVFSRWGLRRAAQQTGSPFVFYLHPWEIDPDQPRVQTSLLSRFRHYTNLSRCERRLRQLTRDFSFTTMAQALETCTIEPYKLTTS